MVLHYVWMTKVTLTLIQAVAIYTPTDFINYFVSWSGPAHPVGRVASRFPSANIARCSHNVPLERQS